MGGTKYLASKVHSAMPCSLGQRLMYNFRTTDSIISKQRDVAELIIAYYMDEKSKSPSFVAKWSVS